MANGTPLIQQLGPTTDPAKLLANRVAQQQAGELVGPPAAPTGLGAVVGPPESAGAAFGPPQQPAAPASAEEVRSSFADAVDNISNRVFKGSVSVLTETPQIELDRLALNNQLIDQETQARKQDAANATKAALDQQQLDRFAGIYTDPNVGLDEQLGAFREMVLIDPDAAISVRDAIRPEGPGFDERIRLRANEGQAIILADAAAGIDKAVTREKLRTMVARQAVDLRSQGFPIEAKESFRLAGLPDDQEFDENFTGIVGTFADAPEERKIIKDINDRQRFADTGELVFPDVTPAPEPVNEKDKQALRTLARTAARNQRKDLGTADIARNAALFNSSIGLESGTGDIAATIALAKMMDPGSVVREGEIDNIVRSGGIFGVLQARLDRLRTEKGALLGTAARNEMRTVAANQLEAANKQFESRATRSIAGFRDAINDDQFLADEFANPFADISIDLPAQTPGGASAEAINFLRTNDSPEVRAQFVEKFGALPAGF